MTQRYSKLNSQQIKAVQHGEGPLLILAGAGSGKTRTIIHRMAYLVHERHIPTHNIVAVTFTNRATAEMLERALEVVGSEASQSLIRTYHSLGLHILRKYSTNIGYKNSFTIWDESDVIRFIQRLLDAHFDHDLNKVAIKYIANTISNWKDSLIFPEELLEKVNIYEYEHADILQEIYPLYEVQKHSINAVDFSDLIYLPVKLLKENQNILEHLWLQYSYFLVDEYQDTNIAQYELIRLLSKKHRNLCVVGDDDQSIYGWRGADVTNILQFNQHFPDATIIKLEQNYRSTNSILNIANHVIKHNTNRMKKILWSERSNTHTPKSIMVASDKQEAQIVANMITDIHNAQSKQTTIGILYRTNIQSRIIEEALLHKQISYKIYGGISFFSRKEVKDVLSYLKILVNPHDEPSWSRLVQTPSRGIGEKSMQKLYGLRESYYQKNHVYLDFITLLEKSDQANLSKTIVKKTQALGEWLHHLQDTIQNQASLSCKFTTLLEDIMTQSGLEKVYAEEDSLLGSNRLDNIEELRTSLNVFQEEHHNATLDNYLQEISLQTSTKESGDNDNHACLMTIHNAKGLEFDVVFIMGLNEDVFPSYLAKRNDQLDEERRLFYVAITRAKDQLILLYSLRRFYNGSIQTVMPSSFLNEIPQKELECQDMSAYYGTFY